MVRADVIQRDLFARMDVAEREEEDVTVENLYVTVGRARMVDVMRTVAAATPVKTPVRIDSADAQFAPPARATGDFPSRYSLARVLSDFVSFGEKDGGEASVIVDWRFAYRQAVSQVSFHLICKCNCWQARRYVRDSGLFSVFGIKMLCGRQSECGRSRALALRAGERPHSSSSDTQAVALLQMKTARDGVSLVTYAEQLVALPGEVKGIDGAVVSLQIVDASGHRLTRTGKLI